ncbi:MULTISPECIES: hypothetical protein [unclassified Desulfovibrio]|uniref:hypothetical protein n=1 Tax=unclassified Desulfovibrio TaxID=2593640 RepID=UPI0013EBC6A5|nr:MULTISPECIES: hypothetical protein [unclassified Desulfovibrio]
MKIRLLITLFILFFPYTIYASDVHTIVQKAEKLFEIGDVDNSVELFEECYRDTQNTICILRPLEILETAYSSLPKPTHNTITVFTPEKTNISLVEYIKKEAIEFFTPSNLISIAITPFALPISFKEDMARYSRLYHFISSKNLPGSPIHIATPEDVSKISSSISFFKSWTQKLNHIARDCYSRDDQEICLGYMKKIASLRKDLDSYYRNFFSYEVASPILAKTQQLIFIADTSKIIGVDENVLRDAARLLGTLNDDLFLYINQEVRNQFLDVYKNLKETAGKSQIEEMAAIQTMQDKFINNRYSEPMF